ncbi:MAG: Na+/H+ antiporter NhaC family protein, partial [Anaerotignum sp.]
MENTKANQNTGDKFYFGQFGVILAFLVMVATWLYMAVQGSLSSKAAGAGAFMGIVVAFFVTKDKKEFQEYMIAGFSSRMLAQMIMAFLLAGTIAKIMDVAGLVKALVWFSSNLGIGGEFMPVVVFLTGAIISSATGTSGGTMTTTTPILLPLAVALGCDVNVVAGAILSGAMFGDNI